VAERQADITAQPYASRSPGRDFVFYSCKSKEVVRSCRYRLADTFVILAAGINGADAAKQTFSERSWHKQIKMQPE
jgi:hypothetical protein